MSYVFEAGETLCEGLLRVMSEEAEAARTHLVSGVESPDLAVHEARKGLKRIRAALRLLRDGVGEAYGVEYRLYRDLGRRLSAARDSWVIAETLRELAGLSDNAWTGTRLAEIADRELSGGSPGLAVFEGGLAAEIAGELAAGRQRLPSLELDGDETAAVGLALARTYRSGRQRMRDVQEAGVPDGSARSGEPMHAWRRRAKDLWHQVSLFVPAWEAGLGPLAGGLSELSQALGSHHDLVVVRAALAERAPELAGTEPVVELFEGESAKLRQTATRLGARIYAERPKPFARRTLDYWRTWQDEQTAVPDREPMEAPA